MTCPDCGGNVDIDHTTEFNPNLPFELVCYECGWFDPQRYSSRENAECAMEVE